MRIRSRGITALAAVALAASGLTVAAGSSASAAAPLDCYGSSNIYSTSGNNRWPSSGWVTTSSVCADINVRPNNSLWVQTCFQATNSCNKATWISAVTWGTAATGVLDGTKFYLHFDRASVGDVAY
ncbi:hypothetical protein OG896_05590 [Streptomyces sp. NBC_00669]|uniref:hypothetical protein n=1 Tax=unclassified Streptomyces TaxID=2593676 RepID=UPI002E2F6C7C|nr:hypothetical protein [Streptomyces sp. NBC_00669]